MVDLDQENLIRRFLLGDLASEQLDRIDQRLLVDEDFLDEVDVAEDELIDDYLRDKLIATDNELFERNFMITDERREHLEFTRGFHKALAVSPAAKETRIELVDDRHSRLWTWPRGRRTLAIGSALGLLLIGSVLVVLWRVTIRRKAAAQATSVQGQLKPNPQNDPGTTVENGDNVNKAAPRSDLGRNDNQATHKAADEHPNDKDLSAQNQQRARTLSVLSVALEPGVLRGGEDNGVKRISVPNGANTVRLKLSLPAGEAELALPETVYEVDVQNGGLKTIATLKNLRESKTMGGKTFVSASIPAALLRPGNYRVILRKRAPNGTAEGAGDYYFSVANVSHGKVGK
jgi:hypothetical protein